MKINLKKIGLYIVIIYIYEIILGGGGTIIKFGGFSLRMFLFLFHIIFFISLFLYFKKIDRIQLAIVLVYTVLLILASFIGIINGAKLGNIRIDVQRLSGFFIILPLFYYIKNSEDILRIDKNIRSGLLMLGLLDIICIIVGKIIGFENFYVLMSNLGDGEIFFRGELGFFYKGFLYLNIGFIFNFVNGNIKKRIIALIFLALIFLTYTRGFLLAIAITIVFYIMFFTNIKVKIKSFFIILATSPILIYFVINTIGKLKDKGISDLARIKQIQEVLERINIVSFFWGHGFGIGVPSREINMEIAFLEIFHKQGIVGLFFWFGILSIIINCFYNIRESNKKKVYLPYVLGTVFVYFQSLTNPFLTNPIGMTFVTIALAFGYKIRKSEVENAKKSIDCSSCLSEKHNGY